MTMAHNVHKLAIFHHSESNLVISIHYYYVYFFPRLQRYIILIAALIFLINELVGVENMIKSLTRICLIKALFL